MKKLLLYTITFISAASLTLFSSCRMGCVKGSGHRVSETHKEGEFNRIEISGGFKVILKQDSSLSFTINADDNLMKYIKSSVDGDKLHIYTRKNLCGSGEMTINIGIKNLRGIAASGAVDINSDGQIKTQDLSFELNGASKVTMDLNAANVTTEGAGNTELYLKGQATSHKIELAGAGKVMALDFVVGNYDIETTGASDCQINVLKDLRVNTTGAADIKYRGNPSNVSSSKTGSASITKIN